MVTTNLAFEEWTEIFGSERLTGALLDRLTHRCHIQEDNGESYRLRQARKRSNSKPSVWQDPKRESPKTRKGNRLDKETEIQTYNPGVTVFRRLPPSYSALQIK